MRKQSTNTSPLPYENGVAQTTISPYGNANGHHSPHDDEPVVNRDFNSNSSKRLSENIYDVIDGLDDELDSAGSGSDEDVFLAGEELERRRSKDKDNRDRGNKEDKDRRDNKGYSNNAPYNNYANGNGNGNGNLQPNGYHNEAGDDGLQHKADYNYDYIEVDDEDDMDREPGTILSSGGEDDDDEVDYYFEEGSSVNGDEPDSEIPHTGLETEGSSIPRFDDVVAPPRDTEPTYDDGSQFPDLGIFVSFIVIPLENK